MELDIPKEVTDELILKFKPLVKNIAYKFKNSGEPLEDLEQLGFIGLINALNLYNQQRKVKFETYASWFISGEIRHYIRDKHQPIRIPHWITELNRRIDEYIVKYKEETTWTTSLAFNTSLTPSTVRLNSCAIFLREGICLVSSLYSTIKSSIFLFNSVIQ